jgi:hypothetical protein
VYQEGCLAVRTRASMQTLLHVGSLSGPYVSNIAVCLSAGLHGDIAHKKTHPLRTLP